MKRKFDVLKQSQILILLENANIHKTIHSGGTGSILFCNIYSENPTFQKVRPVIYEKSFPPGLNYSFLKTVSL